MADEATQVADKTDSGEMDGLRSSLVENVDSLESKQTANQKGKKRKICKEEKQLNKEKKAKILARKKPGFDKEIYEETSYFVKNGLRCVHPYYFTFTTHCKGRWVGRSLIDVFTTEFRAETPEYYIEAIKRGKITVNGKETSADTVLKDNDVICNKVHRHEPPVTDEPLDIVAENDEVVVLNKPSSIPVHPCGRYRHNTVVFLLGKEHGLRNLYTIHRIDRMTSGILMFARKLKKAQELEAQVRERQLEKEYVCRVTGEFPRSEDINCFGCHCNCGVGRLWIDSQNVLEPIDCQQPIVVVSHKVGVCRVGPEGKPCKTWFNRLSYNGVSSVVKCVPHTGRMHQIRVHLQWLGYPIIDDPIYNHEAWGPSRGKGGATEDLVMKVIAELARSPTIIGTVEAKFEEKKSSNMKQMTNTSESSTDLCDGNEPHGVQSCEQEPLDDNISRTTELSNPTAQTVTHCECTETKVCRKVGVSPAENTTVSVDASCSAPSSAIANDSAECLGALAGFYDKNCTECHIKRRDPTRRELTMCLHALSYKGPGWEYVTPMPAWASENWKENANVT